MEIVRIGDKAMKISLCTKEANELSINNDIDDVVIEKRIRQLLLRENMEMKGKVVADIFCARNGGVEIFVSQGEENDILYKDRVTQELTKKAKTNYYAYSFNDFERLILISKRIKGLNYSGSSLLYYDEKEKNYYIILEEVSDKDLKYAFLLEYTKCIKAIAISHIKEHFKCVCKKDAIRKLSRL